MKITVKLFFICAGSFLCACTNSGHENKTVPETDSLSQDSLKTAGQYAPGELKPVFGYRFIVTGDFNGDGKQENLVEHYFSTLDHKETTKFFENTDYEQLVDLTIKKEPYSFMLCDDKLIDTLHISSDPQLFGISYLKNEGDLNGDKTDELSYVVDWADWSNLNTWHIVTYKNQKWEELYSFPIWDWQLPELPEAGNQYGLFGTEDKVISKGNDTINKEMEKELKAFAGLVKKISTNKIRVIFKNEEASEDTMIVDLRHPEKINE